MGRLQIGMAMALVLGACGGGQKPQHTAADEINEGDEFEEEMVAEEEEELIPEEKFEQIQNTFERKATSVARCFPEAVEAGELGSDDRVKLTLGLVIQPDGSPSELKVLASSKRSAALEACVIKSVARWEFTTLPRPLAYSYGFVLQRF